MKPYALNEPTEHFVQVFQTEGTSTSEYILNFSNSQHFKHLDHFNDSNNFNYFYSKSDHQISQFIIFVHIFSYVILYILFILLQHGESLQKQRKEQIKSANKQSVR